MSAAGQASERTPDFIPGWFKPREGDVDPAISSRQAVRFVGTQDFPINFLRPGESVRPARGGLGVNIDRDGEMSLTVLPGYWIVRGADGRPQSWRDEYFVAKWVRDNDRDWIAPAERTRDNPHLTDEQRAAFEESVSRQLDEAKPAPPHVVRQLYTTDDPEAWQGTPPAEGTRRALIRDAVLAHYNRTGEYVDTDRPALALSVADAIESALLQATIDDEAMARGAEALTDGIERVDVAVEAGSTELPEGMPGGLRHSERELWLRGDPDVRVLLDRISRLREDADTDRLLEQREDARMGEDTFKAQRDAALHLLRWLIGDLIPSHLVDLAGEEPS